MKRFKCFFICALVFINIFTSRATEVATIAAAKDIASATKVTFTGELTLQYVTSSGNSYYAFDANNDFVRLRNFANWDDLSTTLKAGDKIQVTEQLTVVSDADNCITFDFEKKAVESIKVVGTAATSDASITTVADLIADEAKLYGAKYVLLRDVKIESVTDFLVSPFPISKIVDNGASIDFYTELVISNFPSKADIYGFVDYSAGKPKLFIPNSDYIKASAFESIAGLKTLMGVESYDDVAFSANVLVTYVKDEADNYVYFVQQDGFDGNPSAMQVVVPKTMNLVYKAGDSVAFNSVGLYMPTMFVNGGAAMHNLSSATYIVKKDNASRLISSNHTIEPLVFADVLADGGWVKYDNCLAITLKGEIVVNDAYTAIGCVGLKLKNQVTNNYETIPVLNTYYTEIGSPSTAIVCGIVCGHKSDDKSYAVLMPRSKNDFLPEVMEFDNIAALKAAGNTPSRAIAYKLNSKMAITGFTYERYEDAKATFYRIFVQDETGAIQLNHQSSNLQKKYTVGDVISSVVGYYTSGGQTYVKDGVVYFASAPAIDIQDEKIIASTEKYVAKPIEVSLADLNDSYASQLVTIKNVTYVSSNNVNLTGTETTKPMIYQGSAWAIVSDKFDYSSEMGSVTGVYYLSGVMTNIIPRSQADIVVEGYQKPVSIENVTKDNNLFVENNVVYAEGAKIEVYDLMGRLIISSINSVNFGNFNNTLYIIKTTYADNSYFITKLISK